MHGLNRPIKDRTIKIKFCLANINGSLTKLPLITLNIPSIAPTAGKSYGMFRLKKNIVSRIVIFVRSFPYFPLI